MSEKSRRSHRSFGSRAAAGAAGRATRAIFADETVGFKKVSVVMINMKSSHSKVKSDWRAMQNQQRHMLDTVQVQSKKYKGVVDSFQGDHCVVTFNAVLNCASHQSKAAHFALGVSHHFAMGSSSRKQSAASRKQSSVGDHMAAHHPKSEVSLNFSTSPLTIGIAAGDCLVGNMGTDGFKRFNVIGPAFSQAIILERMCKQFQAPILTSGNCAQAMSTEMFVDAVGAIGLPSTQQVANADRFINTAKPVVLYSLRGAKHSNANNDAEWMYELKAHDDQDMSLHLNEAWTKFVTLGAADQDLSPVQQLVAEIIRKSAALENQSNTNDNDKGHLPGQTPSQAAASPVQLSAQHRLSLMTLADAVNRSGATLSDYVQLQGARYYEDSVLPAAHLEKDSPI